MKIELSGKLGNYSIEYRGGGFVVEADHPSNNDFASDASEYVAKRLREYDPSFGTMTAYAAHAAARYLGCEIETEVPPGAGELEQAGRLQSGPAKKAKSKKAKRAFCPTGDGGGVDNSCSAQDGSGSGKGKSSGDGRRPQSDFPKSFPPEAQKFRDAIDKTAPGGAEKVWDRARGLAPTPPKEVVDQIAREHEAQSTADLTPEAEAAYDSLVTHIGEQYEALLESGLQVRAWRGEGEPYGDPPGSTKPNSDKMRSEVARTGEFQFFMTERGFGTGDSTPNHPMLRETKYKTADGEPIIANDLFRVVHDMVAHVRGGYSFSTNGEFNGMLTHASTLPRAAWPALFAETFSQNAVYESTGRFARQNAYASQSGAKMIEDELKNRNAPAERAEDKSEKSDGDEPLGYQHIKSRPWLLREVMDKNGDKK